MKFSIEKLFKFLSNFLQQLFEIRCIDLEL